MKGLWRLSVPLLGKSFQDKFMVGRISINIVFLCAIIFAKTRQPTARKLRDPFDGIRYGTRIVIFWYILSIVDLFLHEARLKVACGYLIFDWFISILRYSSNIWMLAGAHWITSRQLFGRIGRPKIWLLTGDFLLFTLSIMSLYYLGSLLANQIIWLEVGDQSTLSLVSVRRTQFEAVFAIIQFLTAFFIIAAAVISLWCEWSENKKLVEYLQVSILATVVLWARATSEMIVVIRYHLQNHHSPRNAELARDTVYGLFTFIFLLLILDTYNKSSRHINRSPLLVNMEDDLRRYIIQHVQEEIKCSKKPPTLQRLFHRLSQNPQDALSADTAHNLSAESAVIQAELLGLYAGYLEELNVKLGGLEFVDLAREF